MGYFSPKIHQTSLKFYNKESAAFVTNGMFLEIDATGSKRVCFRSAGLEKL